MKRALYLFPIGILAVAIWSGATQSRSDRAGKDVIMIRCALDSSFSVKAYQGSPATPAAKSNNCPEQLSVLAQDGFTVLSTGYFDARDQQWVVHTLSR